MVVNFFPTGDTARLAEVLFKLLADPARREYQVQHNLAAVRDLTLEDTCASYLRAFDCALALHQERSLKGRRSAKTKLAKQRESASSETVA